MLRSTFWKLLVPACARAGACDLPCPDSLESHWRRSLVRMHSSTACRIASHLATTLAHERLVLRCHKQASLEVLPAKDALRREKRIACGFKNTPPSWSFTSRKLLLRRLRLCASVHQASC